MHPNKEDGVMKEVGDEPKMMKGKGREHPVILHLSQKLEVMLQKYHIPAPKIAPKFELKMKTTAENQKVPQYKYVTEIMNKANQEEVFQKLLNQLFTIILGEILETSFNLRNHF